MNHTGFIIFNAILLILGILPPALFNLTLDEIGYGLFEKKSPKKSLFAVRFIFAGKIGETVIRIKDQVFREYGDQGAETLEKYFAQIEYTALWCIRMLKEIEHIQSVIPEGVDDVVIVRDDYYELHQVKTRSESQGPWTLSDVLPILCKQYHKRNAFQPHKCHFHFVSNSLADNKKIAPRKSNYICSLYRLKYLLEIRQSGQGFEVKEAEDFVAIELELIPKIQEQLRQEHKEDRVDEKQVKDCFYKTWIETDSLDLNGVEVLEELQNGLTEGQQDEASYTTYQLGKIYDRIVLLVIRKILETKSLEERKITKDDVLQCKVSPIVFGDIDLDKIPGLTMLDKKTYLGGFDATETPIFHRQRKQADWIWRKLEVLGLRQDLERLTTSILDLQGVCRNSICRKQGINIKPGPQILDQLRPQLMPVASSILPGQPDVDEQFCLGIIWKETNLCSAWWHSFDQNRLLQEQIGSLQNEINP